jgi:hypothetical protein
MLSIYILFPQVRPAFRFEDHALENLTASLFSAAFLLSVIAMARFKEKRYPKAYLAIPLISLLGFLDEIGWFERAFNFTVPKIYGDELDGLHDFPTAAYTALQNNLHWLLSIFLLAASCIALFLIVRKYRKYLNRIPGMLTRHPPFVFLLIFAGIMFLAALIDLGIVSFGNHRRFSGSLEEIIEVNAAMALLFASWYMWHNRKCSLR